MLNPDEVISVILKFPNFFIFYLHGYSPQEVDICFKKHMACFKSVPTQVCVVLKSLLFKVTARYRAEVLLPDAIDS